MKTYTFEEAIPQLDKILQRDEETNADVRDSVLAIIDDVRKNGDAALFKYNEKFDGCKLEDLTVTEEEINEAMTAVPAELIAIMEEAAANIRAFHEKQAEQTWTYHPAEGITLGQHITPLERVGLYVPGGKAAYPSTVLMDSIPALVAGVDSVTMVTPPGKDGKIEPVILAAAKIAGIKDIKKVGGAQAVAALAYGTESIPPVNKIVGPGNIFVATAKKEVFGKVDIDMIAGPSEILVIADEKANPVHTAADLLSQAEHDEMAMPILVTTSADFAQKVEAEIEKQLSDNLSREAIARASAENYGRIFICENLDQVFEIANAVAPEHLEIMLEDAMQYLDKVRNAGAIFFGYNAPEPLGDYFAGPNHTLPTSGTAKFSSPLGVYDFIKRSSIIDYSRDALDAVHTKLAAFARSEGLECHARAVDKRF